MAVHVTLRSIGGTAAWRRVRDGRSGVERLRHSHAGIGGGDGVCSLEHCLRLLREREARNQSYVITAEAKNPQPGGPDLVFFYPIGIENDWPHEDAVREVTHNAEEQHRPFARPPITGPPKVLRITEETYIEFRALPTEAYDTADGASQRAATTVLNNISALDKSSGRTAQRSKRERQTHGNEKEAS